MNRKSRAQPLVWHRECLINATRAVSENRTRAEADLARVVQDEERLRFYAAQIAEAERRGMNAFDEEKLLVKRVPN